MSDRDAGTSSAWRNVWGWGVELLGNRIEDVSHETILSGCICYAELNSTYYLYIADNYGCSSK